MFWGIIYFSALDLKPAALNLRPAHQLDLVTAVYRAVIEWAFLVSIIMQLLKGVVSITHTSLHGISAAVSAPLK